MNSKEYVAKPVRKSIELTPAQKQRLARNRMTEERNNYITHTSNVAYDLEHTS